MSASKDVNCVTKRHRKRLLKAEVDRIKNDLTSTTYVEHNIRELLTSRTLEIDQNRQKKLIRDVAFKNDRRVNVANSTKIEIPNFHRAEDASKFDDVSASEPVQITNEC